MKGLILIDKQQNHRIPQQKKTEQIERNRTNMKCTIPEIFWHNREPVLSVDIQPKPLENDPNKNIRLASAGSDQHVLVSVDCFNRF